jgi:hypothetical protein
MSSVDKTSVKIISVVQASVEEEAFNGHSTTRALVRCVLSVKAGVECREWVYALKPDVGVVCEDMSCNPWTVEGLHGLMMKYSPYPVSVKEGKTRGTKACGSSVNRKMCRFCQGRHRQYSAADCHLRIIVDEFTQKFEVRCPEGSSCWVSEVSVQPGAYGGPAIRVALFTSDNQFARAQTYDFFLEEARGAQMRTIYDLVTNRFGWLVCPRDQHRTKNALFNGKGKARLGQEA